MSQLCLAGYPGNTLNELLAAILSEKSKRQPTAILKTLEALRQDIVGMKGLSLEAELRELAACVSSQRNNGGRNGEIVARRLGWDGVGQRTLQVIGEEFSISRERARQICEQATKKLRKVHVFAPALDRTLALIASELPSDVTSVEEHLRADGVTEARFQIEGIVATAEAFGRQLPFGLNKRSGLVVATGDNAGAPPIQIGIRTAAKKAAAHWGVASVAEVVETLRASGNGGITDKRVREALKSQDWATWLDSSHLWFWNKRLSRNPLLRDVDKILSVCHEIGVSELRDGVSRNYRKQGFAPPRQILLEICRQTGRYSVTGDRVSDDGKLDWRTVLPGVELKMVEVLQSHGPLLPTAEFEDRCLAAGMVRSTFYVYIDNSPVIARYARGVYGLRGADVSPTLVESHTAGRSRRKSLIDYGWTSDGNIRIEHRLTTGAIAGGVVSVPASFSSYLEGDFSLTVAGEPEGVVSARNGSAWGFGPYLRKIGCQAGDGLVLTFDLSSRDALVTIESPMFPGEVRDEPVISDDNYSYTTVQSPETRQMVLVSLENPDLQDEDVPSQPRLVALAADTDQPPLSVSSREGIEKLPKAGFGESETVTIPSMRIPTTTENQTVERLHAASLVQRARGILHSFWKIGRRKS